jgi:DNA-binding response OmpR family regulator
LQNEQKATILVVEDEPTLIDTLEYNLTRQGYTVSIASDGFKALELARSLRPDLIVLDAGVGRL